MRVLYGVNGEGMGHATRSQVVIESLLELHEVRVVASGAAFDYLSGVLTEVEQIQGAKFVMEDGEIRRWATVRQNVSEIGSAAPSSIRRWIVMTREWRPDVVVTDFEPLSAISIARAASTPFAPAIQQAIGAAIRSDECAAIAASFRSLPICSSSGGSAPTAPANDVIHSSALASATSYLLARL